MVPCFQRERGEKGENGEQKEKTITKCSFPRNFFRSFHFSSPSLRAANEPQWKWKRSRDNGVISSNPGKKKNLSERLWIYCATSQHWFFLSSCVSFNHQPRAGGASGADWQLAHLFPTWKSAGGTNRFMTFTTSPGILNLVLIFCCIVTLIFSLLPP